MKNSKSNRMIWLIIGIPIASVLMGIITMTVALNTGDGAVPIEEQPLSKTSWKAKP